MSIAATHIREIDTPRVAPGYIISRWADWVFFIGSPLIALVATVLLVGVPFVHTPVVSDQTLLAVAVYTLVQSHLFIVIFRSHFNRDVFWRFPVSFTAVPVTLFLSMCVSPYLLVCGLVVAVFWDVYHSGMQTFGLGRIYDMKAGNAPDTGRWLDKWLNILLYAGPIAAGVNLMPHVETFNDFAKVGDTFFTQVPAMVNSQAHVLTWTVIAGVGAFMAYYVYGYWRLARNGYRVAPQKVALFVTTGLTSVYVWGFMPPVIAFIVMNMFHAVQYFAIVYWMERKALARTLRLGHGARAFAVVFGLIVAVGFAYGLAVAFGSASGLLTVSGDHKLGWLTSLFVTVSLMHFWYDGFIWSVAKKHVKT